MLCCHDTSYEFINDVPALRIFTQYNKLSVIGRAVAFNVDPVIL